MNYNEAIVPGGHFKWGEYCYLPQWKKYAVPNEQERQNAIKLFEAIEKYIRVPLDKLLTISSGARTAEYTEYLRTHGVPGAAIHSPHIEWKAVDLSPPKGMTNAEFWHWCDKRWPGRQEALASTQTWCHLDTRQFGERIRFRP